MEELEYLQWNIDRLFSTKRKGNSKREILDSWRELCNYFERCYLFYMLHNALRREKVATNKISLSKELLSSLVPSIPTVYKLYSKRKLVYIGSTINLYTRCLQHKRDGKEFDDVEIALTNKNIMLPLEHKLILHYQPILNKEVSLKEVNNWEGVIPRFEQPTNIDRYLVPCTHLDIQSQTRKDKYFMSNGILIPKTFKPYY